ncbi:MAG TPA: ABC transporter permease [Candidatus Thermoplasmatota archaeon]|nr:ABC transporter permease [Candidatus Thermoplasmatota archaeon]
MTAAHELQAMYALWLREMKVFFREKPRIVGAIITPFILIAVIGTGFGATTEFVDPEYAQFSYEQFMFPGIVAMGVLFGTVFFGLGIVWDRKLDVLKEVLVAPVSRTTIFFGKVIGGSTQAVGQAALMLAIGAVWLRFPAGGALLALVFALLLAIAFVSVGLFLGSFFDSFEGFQLIVNFLVLPLFFLSGALYPVDGLPVWLTWLTRANPATYGVDGLRGALLGVHAFSLWLDATVLVVFGGAFVLAGALAFKRMT